MSAGDRGDMPSLPMPMLGLLLALAVSPGIAGATPGLAADPSPAMDPSGYPATAPHARSGGEWRVAPYVVGAGGGRSSAGNFEITGTAGQADAGGLVLATGGRFVVVGGFWPAAAPTPLRPDLVLSDGFE